GSRDLAAAVRRNEQIGERFTRRLAQTARVDKDNDLMAAVLAVPGVGLVSGEVSIVPPRFTAGEPSFLLNPEAKATARAAGIKGHWVDREHRLQEVRAEQASTQERPIEGRDVGGGGHDRSAGPEE